MVKLTGLETRLLNAMRENEYNDALKDGYTWMFTTIDNSGIGEKSVGGVISSLIKKGLVVAEKGEDSDTIRFTEEGKSLFDNADGRDCSWGGSKLLKVKQTSKEIQEIDEEKRRKMKSSKKVGDEVEIVAFTGMSLGKFRVYSKNNSSREIHVKTGKGKLMIFSADTGIQKNAKNSKFANRIKRA